MKRLQCQKGTDEINHGGTKFIVNNYTVAPLNVENERQALLALSR